MYTVEILIPTARLAFAVQDGRVQLMPEHQPPEAYHVYQAFRSRHDVVGMTTFPNTVLLRGPSTILVDPGIHFQNEPVLAASATSFRRRSSPAGVHPSPSMWPRPASRTGRPWRAS
jgi:hypothetical protein